MTDNRTERRSYSLREFCERNSISRATIYREIERGKLIVRKVGSKCLVTSEDEQAWIDGMVVK